MVAMAFNHAVQVWEAVRNSTAAPLRPVHLSWRQRNRNEPAAANADQQPTAIDIVPTILDSIGVEPARDDQGAAQSRIDRRQHTL